MSRLDVIMAAGLGMMLDKDMALSSRPIKPRGRFYGQSEEAKAQAIAEAQGRRERRNKKRAELSQ